VRLLLGGLFFGVIGCDAVFGLEATPLVAASGDGGGLVGSHAAAADGAAPNGAASDAGVPGEASIGAPDATITGTSDAGSGGPMDAGAPTNTDGASGSPPVSLADCVLLMHMDEATWSDAGGAVIDSSGQGNDGTVVGTMQTVEGGKFGRAAQFGGAGYIAIPNAPSLNPTTALTFAAWISPTGFTSDGLYPGILGKRQAYAADSAFAMFLWTDNALFADIEDYRSYSNAMIMNNQGWTHVAVVYDGTLADSTKRVSIYINGLFDSSSDAGTTMSPHDEELDVGYLTQGSYLDPNAYFIGLIDEVAIWNRALSKDEIAALASATTPL
jgi:hypothetical protein